MGRPAKPKTVLGQRIIEIRGDRLRVEFAEELGVSQASLASYELGRSTPNMDFLKALVSCERVDLNWLLTGDGDMYLSEEQKGEVLDAGLMEIVVNTVAEYNAKTRAKLSPEKHWLVYMICYRKLEEIKDRYPAAEAHARLREELLDLLKLATM
jgi:transcriptional regulator with XRE-family HTH domain